MNRVNESFDLELEQSKFRDKGVLIYQAGDSYPAGDDMEIKLAKFLADDLGMGFLSQNDILKKDGMAPVELGKVFTVQQRIETLTPKINSLPAPIVLIGRSSGARVASVCAANSSQVKAVIGLAYPFKHPDKPVEEDRYIHLESTAVPTLIVQGVRDEYGGIVANQKYRFSNSVDFFYLDADHGMHLVEKSLNLVRMRAKRFIVQALTDCIRS